MKAISLIQPWASLVAMGEKKIETRSWKTNYRGPLLIHASVGMPKWAKGLCWKFAKLLGIKEYNGSFLYYLEHGVGSFGKIIAKCKLVDCIKIASENTVPFATLENGRFIVGTEYYFGDYTPGRYAWILEDIEMLPVPITAKGQLGLWEFDCKGVCK